VPRHLHKVVQTEFTLKHLLSVPPARFRAFAWNELQAGFLNAGQVPVLTMDQPLYEIGRQIQKYSGTHQSCSARTTMWRWMAGLKMLGDLLEGRGWCKALTQANVAADGSADSFLRASHVGKTRRAHQVGGAPRSSEAGIHGKLGCVWHQWPNDCDCFHAVTWKDVSCSSNVQLL